MTAPGRLTVEPWVYAVRAVLVAILTGTTLVTLAVLSVRAQQQGFLAALPALPAITGPVAPADSIIAQAPVDRGAAGQVVYLTFGGMVLAGLLAFALLAPLESIYRRLGLATVAGFATFLFMLPAMPVDLVFGQRGLLVLALVLAGLSAFHGVRLARMLAK